MLRYRKELTMVMINGNASWHHRCHDSLLVSVAGAKLISGFLFASTPQIGWCSPVVAGCYSHSR
jgi:hypothetical protein